MTFSLIIPVYNAAPYLKDCLDSVLRQTFEDFEVILIDDHSSDSSGDICEQYALVDARIVVFHQPVNQGVSAARNQGIALASGRWLTFIDSDDYILPDFLDRLYAGIGNAEFILSGDRYLADGKLLREDVLPAWAWQSDKPCTEQDMKYIENITSLHGKLFRRDLILRHHIQFNHSLRFGEDRDFSITYLAQISKVSYLPYAGYCYNTDIAGSLSKQKIQNLLFTDINYWNKVHVIIGDACPKYQVNRLYNFLVDNLLSVYKSCGFFEAIMQIKRVKPLINSTFLHQHAVHIIAPHWLRFIILQLF